MAALVLASAVAIAAEPPVYAGRTLDDWQERIKSIDPNSAQSAAEAPGLMELVESEDVPWYTRRQAALTLGRMGRFGADAVPLLQELATREQDDAEESTPLWAVKSLSLFGAEAAPATETLVEIFEDDDRSIAVRGAAAEALARIGGANPASIAAMHRFLLVPPAPGAADEPLYELTLECVPLVGTSAGVLLPALMRSAQDSREEIRRRAAAAIGSLGSAAEPAISLLFEMMAADEVPAVRDAAMNAIGGIGVSALPTLTTALGMSHDEELLWRSATAIGEMGRRGRSALPLLVRLQAESAVPRVKLAAAEAAWKVAAETEQTVPTLIGLFDAGDRQIRAAAVRQIVAMAAARPEVTLQLEQAPEPRTDAGRRALSEALRKIRLAEAEAE